MRLTEQNARQICALDLRARGIRDEDVPALVDRYWPVVAMEIRQGITDGQWPFDADTLASLSKEYRALSVGR